MTTDRRTALKQALASVAAFALARRMPRGVDTASFDERVIANAAPARPPSRLKERFTDIAEVFVDGLPVPNAESFERDGAGWGSVDAVLTGPPLPIARHTAHFLVNGPTRVTYYGRVTVQLRSGRVI